MGLRAPSYTQAPNELFDEWLPKLKLVELRVLMVIIRKTFGWHKRFDRISLSQLEKLTGSRKGDVINATKKLEKMNLVRKTVSGDCGIQTTYYELIVEECSSNLYSSESQTGGGMNFIPTKETLTKEKKKNKKKKGDSPPAPRPTSSFHEAEKFYSKLKERDPKMKQPEFKKWQKVLNDLHETDGRPWEEIWRAFDWCLLQKYWGEYIVSPRRLRDNFTSIVLAMSLGGEESGCFKTKVIEACKDHPEIIVENQGIRFMTGQGGNSTFISYNSANFNENILDFFKRMGISIKE